ncbi:hypothetical protein H6P81_000281 [Aristolochia fimbriata]|uniref:Uncharacterized protein n=1 Tax=Aristolochia fimbriata TaxID=158543 RepID=A0AAV7F441_ARIFI|nr:hypothetical protein H6P81_000281 [Aristolochia fimbriata]
MKQQLLPRLAELKRKAVLRGGEAPESVDKLELGQKSEGVKRRRRKVTGGVCEGTRHSSVVCLVEGERACVRGGAKGRTLAPRRGARDGLDHVPQVGALTRLGFPFRVRSQPRQASLISGLPATSSFVVQKLSNNNAFNNDSDCRVLTNKARQKRSRGKRDIPPPRFPSRAPANLGPGLDAPGPALFCAPAAP